MPICRVISLISPWMAPQTLSGMPSRPWHTAKGDSIAISTGLLPWLTCWCAASMTPLCRPSAVGELCLEPEVGIDKLGGFERLELHQQVDVALTWAVIGAQQRTEHIEP